MWPRLTGPPPVERPVHQCGPEFDAAADMQVKYEEAAKAFENIPAAKHSRALERARAKRAAPAAHPPRTSQLSCEATHATKHARSREQ